MSATLHTHLTQLESLGLIRLARMTPELEYLFRHQLVQDAVYDSLLKNDRRRLHQAVGTTFEALYPGREKEYAAQLAYHFYEAGDDSRALRYFSLAADQALDQCANIEAEEFFRAAMRITGFRGERAGLLTGLGRAIARQSRHEEAVSAWKEASELYLQMGDDSSAAETLARAAWAMWLTGDTVVSLRLCEDALKQFAESGESEGLAALLHEAARIYYFNGVADQAEPLCRRALEIAERLGATETHAASLTTYGTIIGGRGQIEEAKIALEKAIELAEANRLLFPAARAHNNLGSLLAETIGEQRAGKEHFLRAAEINHRRGSPYEELFCLGNVAETCLTLGDFEEMDPTLAQMRDLVEAIGSRGVGVLVYHRCEAYLLHCRGEWQQAEARYREVLKLAHEMEDLQMISTAGVLLAELLIEQGRWDETTPLLDESIEIGDTGLGAGRVWARAMRTEVLVRQGHIFAAHDLLAETRVKVGEQMTPLDESWLMAAEARFTAVTDPAAAAALYERLATLQAQMGVRLYHAQTLRAWADALIAAGDRERASAVLHEALTEFVSMGLARYASLVEEHEKGLTAAID